MSSNRSRSRSGPRQLPIAKPGQVVTSVGRLGALAARQEWARQYNQQAAHASRAAAEHQRQSAVAHQLAAEQLELAAQRSTAAAQAQEAAAAQAQDNHEFLLDWIAEIRYYNDRPAGTASD